MISVQEARKKGVIKKDTIPVAEILVFPGTRARIANIKSFGYLRDAVELVASELQKTPEEFDKKEYFCWFMKTFAEQIGRMHKLGYIHGYLTTHNVTLDGAIVDLDGVKLVGRENSGEFLLSLAEYLAACCEDECQPVASRRRAEEITPTSSSDFRTCIPSRNTSRAPACEVGY